LSGFLLSAAVCFGFPALFGWLLSSHCVPPFFQRSSFVLFQGSIPFDIFSHEGSRAWYKVLCSTSVYLRATVDKCLSLPCPPHFLGYFMICILKDLITCATRILVHSCRYRECEYQVRSSQQKDSHVLYWSGVCHRTLRKFPGRKAGCYPDVLACRRGVARTRNTTT
jgi:hypothetical protein